MWVKEGSVRWGMDPGNEPNEGIRTFGTMVELAELPPGTMLTLHDMVRIFGKSSNTVMRAAGEALPHFLRKLLAEICRQSRLTAISVAGRDRLEAGAHPVKTVESLPPSRVLVTVHQ